MMPDQKDRLLKLYGDNYESHIKGANYLLAAHAAGFVGCFALIKTTRRRLSSRAWAFS
jgi:hypothetical protein